MYVCVPYIHLPVCMPVSVPLCQLDFALIVQLHFAVSRVAVPTQQS